MQLYMYMFFCLHIWLVYYLHDIKSIHIPPNSMNISSYSVKYVQVSQASQSFPPVHFSFVCPEISMDFSMFFPKLPRRQPAKCRSQGHRWKPDTWGRTEPGRLGPLTPWNPWKLEMEMSNKENREKTLVKVLKTRENL